MSAQPLLASFGPPTALPAFDRFDVAQVVPTVKALLEAQDAAFAKLEAEATPSWSVVERMRDLGDPLGAVWGMVNHLHGVKSTAELRKAHEEAQPLVVDASLRIGQSKAVYAALQGLRDGPDFGKLAPDQRRIVERLIRGAVNAGVALEGAAKERFTVIAKELAELQTTFSNHTLDATKAFHLDLTESADIAGLPAGLVAILAQRAKAGGHAQATPEAGPWRVGIDFAVLGPFLEHAKRRDLRETLYRAMIARASTGALDNGPLMVRILRLRQEQAALLGHRTYADWELTARMARSVAEVDALLTKLRDVAKPKAHAEFAELTAFAREESKQPALELAPWDIAFWAERLRERRYAYTDEEVRPYFALPQVLDGMFALVSKLFGITVRAADGEVPVWHKDVRFFRIARAGADIAAFYLDPYSRPEDKRGGAWMDVCRERVRDANGLRLPVAYLVCNQTPPTADRPSLMSFGEVETLFHEFGHGLQHMLTTIDHPEAAGISGVEWDAVELPSQFMENWCQDEATVLGTPGKPGLARHWQTGAPIPAELFRRIKSASTYRAGSMTLRQVGLSSVDLELHHRVDPLSSDEAATPLAVQRRILGAHAVLKPLDEDRTLWSFGHIFAGGYAAGYYSYKWAEVLSADAFAAFEEAGLDQPEKVEATGRRFADTVLALGGGVHPAEVFRRFRGRDPSPDALLRHSGLA